jgi:hypothetical protein
MIGLACLSVALVAGADDKPKDYSIHLTDQDLAVIWTGLQELPGKVADETKAKIQAQYLQQKKPEAPAPSK